jgi:hypothetical protein
MLDDKNSFFWRRSIGDFSLCVKNKKDEVDARCGSRSIYLEIRLTSPLNSSPHLNMLPENLGICKNGFYNICCEAQAIGSNQST